jgi:hypothetical protein
MELDKLAEIEKHITNAGQVILNKLRTAEQVISANVDVVNALADIDYDLDTKWAAISIRPENTEKPTAHIKRLYKAETAAEHRLRALARGYRSTLKNIEYGIYK